MPLIVEGVEGIRALKNRPLGTSAWLEVTQEMIDAFAQVTGDDHWSHTDVQRARATPLGRTTAQGMLTASLLVRLRRSVMEYRNIGRGVNYGFERTRMPAPVLSGDRIQCTMQMGDVADVDDGVHYTLDCVVRSDRAAKPVLVTQWIQRHYPAPGAGRAAATAS